MFFSTTGSSSCNSCRSVRSCDIVPPSYLYLLVALNISVNIGCIQVAERTSHERDLGSVLGGTIRAKEFVRVPAGQIQTLEAAQREEAHGHRRRCCLLRGSGY